MTPVANRKWDVAISYSSGTEDDDEAVRGDEAARAANLAQLLQANGLQVFLDSAAPGRMAGEDLSTGLKSIFRDEARLCCALISKGYLTKRYTVLELEAAKVRHFSEASRDYLVPILVDNLPLPEDLAETAALRWPPVDPESIAEVLTERCSIRRAQDEIVITAFRRLMRLATGLFVVFAVLMGRVLWGSLLVDRPLVGPNDNILGFWLCTISVVIFLASAAWAWRQYRLVKKHLGRRRSWREMSSPLLALALAWVLLFGLVYFTVVDPSCSAIIRIEWPRIKWPGSA